MNIQQAQIMHCVWSLRSSYGEEVQIHLFLISEIDGMNGQLHSQEKEPRYLLTYLRTYLLTYSMQQRPAWEANLFLATQEIPHILWNPKVHYCIHKCPPPVSILSQLDPDHRHTSHFLQIHAVSTPVTYKIYQCGRHRHNLGWGEMPPPQYFFYLSLVFWGGGDIKRKRGK
jgi:hypothetical protein